MISPNSSDLMMMLKGHIFEIYNCITLDSQFSLFFIINYNVYMRLTRNIWYFIKKFNIKYHYVCYVSSSKGNLVIFGLGDT